MPRAPDNLTNPAVRVTLCVLVMFVAACDVEAPETGAPERVPGLSTPPLLTGPELAAATRVAEAETPPLEGRVAGLQARAAALQGAVVDPADSARLLVPQPAR